jgi:hypothetical protein
LQFAASAVGRVFRGIAWSSDGKCRSGVWILPVDALLVVEMLRVSRVVRACRVPGSAAKRLHELCRSVDANYKLGR